jgi:hypothetical protein
MIVKEHLPQFILYIKDNVLPELHALMVKMQTVLPAKQFQLALMDIENTQIQLADLYLHGPSTPFKDIPLEESEIADDTQVVDGKTDV